MASSKIGERKALNPMTRTKATIVESYIPDMDHEDDLMRLDSLPAAPEPSSTVL